MIERVVRLSERRDRCVSLLIGPERSLVVKTAESKETLRREWSATRYLGGFQLAPRAVRYLRARRADLMLEEFVCSDDNSNLWFERVDAGLLSRLEDSLIRLYQAAMPKGVLRSRDSFLGWILVKLAKWSSELKLAGKEADAARASECAYRVQLSLRDFSPALLHGDLRPDNIILSQGRFVLIDFEHVNVGDPLFDLAKLKNSLPVYGDDVAARIARNLPGLEEHSSQFIETRLSLYAEVHEIGVLAWETRRLHTNNHEVPT